MKVKKRSKSDLGGGPRSKRLNQRADDGEGPSANGKRLFVVLEDCSLEVAKVGAEHVVLSSDKYANWLRKHNMDPAQYRPDILHQCLLMLQDCPLNKAGFLRVFFHTKQNVLVNVSAQCRIPRTFDRFCGLMVQLLHKRQIRAEESSQKLLSVVKNPVTDHLPLGCRKYLTSLNCLNLVSSMADVVRPDADEPVVIVVGGIAHGKIKTDYTEGEIKISNYPLSAALCCAKLTSAFEQLWGVL
ncbi:hypothetical protein GPALN_010941 [Globodera pallida]|nr:hypothetical protein GPALN_010941 [Globodera pallida]